MNIFVAQGFTEAPGSGLECCSTRCCFTCIGSGVKVFATQSWRLEFDSQQPHKKHRAYVCNPNAKEVFQLLATQKFTEPSGSFSPRAKKRHGDMNPQCPSKKTTRKDPISFLLLLLQHPVVPCISLFQESWPRSVRPPLGL